MRSFPQPAPRTAWRRRFVTRAFLPAGRFWPSCARRAKPAFFQRIAGRPYISPRTAVKRHNAAARHLCGKAAGKRAGNALPPVLCQHPPLSPHGAAVRRSSPQGPPKPAVKRPHGQHVQFAPLFTQRVRPTGACNEGQALQGLKSRVSYRQGSARRAVTSGRKYSAIWRTRMRAQPALHSGGRYPALSKHCSGVRAFIYARTCASISGKQRLPHCRRTRQDRRRTAAPDGASRRAPRKSAPPHFQAG